MKKILTFAFVFVLSLTLTACSGDSGDCSHKDNDDDHICDSCDKTLTKCKDKNSDHECDTCGETLTECEDEDDDHVCDTCGDTLTECEDEDDDHKCDVCEKTLSNCKDKNSDHECDTCGETLTECVDDDTDGECDVCGDTMKLDITGVTLSDKSFVYDGTEKALTVTGELPNGVSANYTSNSATDAGVYNVSVTLSGEGYNTLTLTATLTITKADITGITVDGTQSAFYNGEAMLPDYSGTLPAGVTPKYYFDGIISNVGKSEVGTYQVKIFFEGINYNKKEFTVTFTIKEKPNLAGLANTVISSFGSVPDAWSFLPESFAPENRLTSHKAPIDYSSFVNMSAIPYNGMGKQLNMVYGVLNKMDTALGYVNTVYGSLNVVKGLYSTFLDDNPEDYQSFTGNAGPFSFTISLDGTVSTMVATVGPVEVIITSDTENDTYGARVQLTSTTVLKYEVLDNKLTVALNILGSASTLIEFERNGTTVEGVVYEFLSVAGLDLVSTSAMIHIDNSYTTLIGTKGDFLPLSDGRNCEIYRSDTGEYVGAKVREKESASLVYNTYWFPLANLTGISNIKMIEENNGELNPFTVYINNGTSFVGTKRNLLGLGSRHFDIEFKSMYFYTYNEAEETYESIELLVPMIFVQEENLADFEEEFYNANKNTVPSNISLEVTANDLSAIEYGYATLLSHYDEIKGAVTINDVKAYCGIKTEESEE